MIVYDLVALLGVVYFPSNPQKHYSVQLLRVFVFKLTKFHWTFMKFHDYCPRLKVISPVELK